jgi:hypothetical protein
MVNIYCLSTCTYEDILYNIEYRIDCAVLLIGKSLAWIARLERSHCPASAAQAAAPKALCGRLGKTGELQ